MNVRTKVPRSVLLDDVLRFHPKFGMALKFEEGDLLVIGPGRAFEVKEGSIGPGPDGQTTALVRFSNDNDDYDQEGQWWALARQDGKRFGFIPIDDDGVIVGEMSGPYLNLRLIPVGAADPEAVLARAGSQLHATDSAQVLGMFWSRLPRAQRQRLARRELAVTAAEADSLQVGIPTVLRALGVRDFESLLVRGPPDRYYLSRETAGVILCGGVAATPARTLMLSLRLQPAGAPPDSKAEHLRVQFEYEAKSPCRLKPGVREVEIVSAAATACPVNDQMAVLAPMWLWSDAEDTYLGLQPVEGGDDEGARVLLVAHGGCVTSQLVARAIWQGLPADRRDQLWLVLAGEDSDVRARMVQEAETRVQTSKRAAPLRAALAKWRRLSTFRMLVYAADFADPAWPESLPLGLRSLGGLVLHRDQLRGEGEEGSLLGVLSG